MLDDAAKLHSVLDDLGVSGHLCRISARCVRNHRHRVVSGPVRKDQERVSRLLHRGQPIFRFGLWLRHTRLFGSEPCLRRSECD